MPPEDDRKFVLKHLSGDIYGPEANVVCPHCGSEYSHITRVGTLLGCDANEADVYDGTVVIGASAQRRSAVEIVMECEECEKPFGLVVQQHKGVNCLQIDLTPPPVPASQSPPDAG